MDELAARWSDVLDQLDPEDKKVVLFELEGKTRAQQEAMLDEVYAHISEGKRASLEPPKPTSRPSGSPRSAPVGLPRSAPVALRSPLRRASNATLPPSPTRFKDAKWEEAWKLLDLSDVRDHPLWLMDLHDVLFNSFHELHSIFTHYCKSISGAETARDAELMDMQEWLVFIRDCKVASKSFNRGLAENVFVTATSHINRPKALGDADRSMAFYEFVEAICRCAHLRENYSSVRKVVPLDACVEYLLDECVLPYAQRDMSHAVRQMLEADPGVRKAFEVYGEALYLLHAHLARQRRSVDANERPTISMEQYLELLQSRGIIGDVSVRQLSEVRVPKHTLKTYRAVLTVAKAKRSFVESQRVDEAQMGSLTGFELATELDYEEFLECIGRCGLLKYELIEQMKPADRVTALILNVLSRMDVPSVMTAATLVRAQSTFLAKRDSRPLPNESDEEHAKWLECWELLDLSDIRDHPEFNHDLHDVLHASFAQLRLIFPFYCKSISGAETARDAELMDMQEWLVFIRDCKVASKSFNRGLAENVFVTATSHVNRPKALGDADRSMAFYEFVEAICRCAHLRENYSSLKRHVPLPECVRDILEECVLPYAQRDMSHAVRQMLEADPGVRKAFEVYGEALYLLHAHLARQRRSVDANERPTISMEQYLELLQSRGIIGDVSVRQLSEVRVPKHTLKTYRAVLTVAKAKRSFVESQRVDEAQMGSLTGFELATELDYEEFLECIGRCGLLKYELIEQMKPADRVTALILNVLSRMDVPSVMTAATLVRAQSTFLAKRDSRPLPNESDEEHAKWLECWELLDLSDIRDHPEFNHDLHDVLHASFAQLRLIFPFYCKSISGAETARDAELMDMQEWLVFIRDCKVASKSFNRGLAENVFVTATSHVNRPKALGDADRSMAFYEFVEAICRCAHLRENYSSLKRHVPLPECVRDILEECVLPYAQRDMSHAVRQMLEADPGVRKAFEVYGEALYLLHAHLARQRRSVDANERPTISMEQYLELLQSRGIIGDVSVRQESEVRVPKHTLKTYRAVLTVAKAKRSFVESQRVDEAQMGSLTGFELATELDYEEFLECIGRCGLLKYELIEQMKPADRVTALILNVLSRMDVPSVMTAATLVRAPNSFSAQHDSARLPDESTGEHEQWLRTWRSIETSLADLHGFPMWLKDVHNTLHSGLQELSACFTRIATRGGEFELDFPAWQSFVRSAATRMQEVASQEDATEVAAIVFGMAASSIGGVAKLNFPAFLAALPRLAFGLCNPHFGRTDVAALGQLVRSTRVKPVPWALVSLLDTIEVRAETPAFASPRGSGGAAVRHGDSSPRSPQHTAHGTSTVGNGSGAKLAVGSQAWTP
ncbi:hypothetical protein KFE25_007834 [Diacronema lutheri]|uniref:Uncharacterized protein n=2 Tax=Diacronema lutheri TaxID=2081491 RepID=A0A8J5XHZ4_DIALT|nr:hypothetical protein KFE25_007834 [Diacronema lutheri]